MFVEASALSALLLDETRARILAGRLQTVSHRVTAPSEVLRAIASIADHRGLPPEDVAPVLSRFLEAMAIRLVAVPASLALPAAEAMGRFSLTPEHALAYAAARYYRLPLLFEDGAFARTDIPAG